MSQPLFIGRQLELNVIRDRWASSKAELLILYGRRRVGKTRLFTHWIETDRPRALYWVAEPSSALDQLRSFSQAMYNFLNPEMPAPDDFTYASWAQAFQQMARAAQSERLAVVMDEFTYLLAVDASIAATLQNAWDHLLQGTRLFLAISGSHMGMLERHLLSYQAPLYGRATARLNLLPLPFANTRLYFPNYQADERVALYAMLGGVPAYWGNVRPNLSIDQNLRRQFLERDALLKDEPRLLLQDFVSETHNYVAILRAIAEGHRTPKEIASQAGLPDKHISAYLAKLLETGFVERHIPVTKAAATRLGRHYLTDPFLRFYFRFLSRRQSQLALGVQDQALAEIKRHLLDFIGTHTWEELCREWLLRAGDRAGLPFMPDQVGSVWTRQAQIDVVGINTMEKTLILGECKWSPRPQDHEVLETLVEKTRPFVPADGQWRIHYLGFAHAGWTAAAQSYAARATKLDLNGPNWRVTGMRLLNLEQVDSDLAAWTP
ncbi:MAG: ATP-binding protein [Anaerolineales bacterium]|nr:ATP-binding protein [Anaerolineales bacterium]